MNINSLRTLFGDIFYRNPNMKDRENIIVEIHDKFLEEFLASYIQDLDKFLVFVDKEKFSESVRKSKEIKISTISSPELTIKFSPENLIKIYYKED